MAAAGACTVAYGGSADVDGFVYVAPSDDGTATCLSSVALDGIRSF